MLIYRAIAGDNSAPQVIGNNEKGRQVFEYIKNITEGAELNAKFEWDGDEVMLYT